VNLTRRPSASRGITRNSLALGDDFSEWIPAIAAVASGAAQYAGIRAQIGAQQDILKAQLEAQDAAQRRVLAAQTASMYGQTLPAGTVTPVRTIGGALSSPWLVPLLLGAAAIGFFMLVRSGTNRVYSKRRR